MTRVHLLLTVVVTVFFSTKLISQDLDQGYVRTFSWGGIAVTQEKIPAFASYEPNLFHFKDGKFFITAGEDVDLHCRYLLKGGKTYGQHLNALKKSTNKKVATLKDDYIRTLFYVSHDEAGAQLYTKWPASMSELPEWKEICVDEINFAPAADWVSSRFTLSERQADFTSLISWLKRARPGWKIYIVHVAGYRREAPELKYYDKTELRYMIPLEYVDTEPLAVATVEVEKSTNPLLAWSYNIEKMPAEQKGEKDGIMSVMKDGIKNTTFNFGIEYKYLNKVTKLHNFYVNYVYADGMLIGGFYAQDVPSIETGIQNTFYEAIKSALYYEKIH
ncbi:MAG: hypothetical protein C4539_09475 [Ignavibacteriales bacterium]|nr:MAG: hypothetical protein C4539_09475 [Ignavibacteriales bacterium]